MPILYMVANLVFKIMLGCARFFKFIITQIISFIKINAQNKKAQLLIFIFIKNYPIQKALIRNC